MYARPLCSFQPLPCVTDCLRAPALQKGHSGPVTALAYNAEGDKLASYSLVDGRIVVWAAKASFFEYFSAAPSPQQNFNSGKADRTLKLASAHAHQFQSSDGVVCGGSFVVACCACGWVWNRRTHSASRGPQGAASVGWPQAPAALSPLGSSGPRHLHALIVLSQNLLLFPMLALPAPAHIGGVGGDPGSWRRTACDLAFVFCALIGSCGSFEPERAQQEV